MERKPAGVTHVVNDLYQAMTRRLFKDTTGTVITRKSRTVRINDPIGKRIGKSIRRSRNKL